MKALDESQDIRRRSSFTAVSFFIPWLNYIYFLIIIRGAYLSMKNFYLLHKRNPDLKESFRLLAMFIFHATLQTAVVGGLLLFVFAVNPFGEMMDYYWNGLHSFLGGMDLETTRSFFSLEPGKFYSNLISEARSMDVFSVLFVFIICSYAIFAMVGLLLGWVTNTFLDAESYGF